MPGWRHPRRPPRGRSTLLSSLYTPNVGAPDRDGNAGRSSLNVARSMGKVESPRVAIREGVEDAVGEVGVAQHELTFAYGVGDVQGAELNTVQVHLVPCRRLAG